MMYFSKQTRQLCPNVELRLEHNPLRGHLCGHSPEQVETRIDRFITLRGHLCGRGSCYTSRAN
jgi:hypothetical protein